MLEDIVAPEPLDEVERGAEPDRAGDVGGAGLKPVRRLLVFGLLESDAEDHVAAALPGRHRGEQIVAPIERADPGRSIDLMTGKGIEVAVQRLHIDRQPRRCLAAVDQHLGAPADARA